MMRLQRAYAAIPLIAAALVLPAQFSDAGNSTGATVLAQATPKRAASADKGKAGKATYEATCSVCHATGVAGAPKFGNTDDWGPRIAKGVEALYGSALKGTEKGMPPKGGNADLPDADVKAVVDYMVAAAQPRKEAAPKPAAELKSTEASKPESKSTASDKPDVKPADKSADSSAVAEKPASDAKPPAEKLAPEKSGGQKPAPEAKSADKQAEPKVTGSQVSIAEVNAFNRLLKPPGKRNLPPPEDGIHDPENDGTHALQHPLQSFDALTKSNAGNRVNWVQSLYDKKIQPRWDRADGNAEPVVMDLNIIRKVKGSMPDVVYPHKQHTEWLDCSNCHPAIFVPQNGANQISMASILLGQKCGVCHGKVAFPVSECRLCHSRKKALATAAGATPP